MRSLQHRCVGRGCGQCPQCPAIADLALPDPLPPPFAARAVPPANPRAVVQPPHELPSRKAGTVG